MKIKIELNKPLLEPSDVKGSKDGLFETETKCSSLLALMLKSAESGDALKFLNWAIDLYRTHFIEVDDSDFKTIREYVAGANGYRAFAKGFILRELDAAKEAAGKAA